MSLRLVRHLRVEVSQQLRVFSTTAGRGTTGGKQGDEPGAKGPPVSVEEARQRQKMYNKLRAEGRSGHKDPHDALQRAAEYKLRKDNDASRSAKTEAEERAAAAAAEQENKGAWEKLLGKFGPDK